MAYDSDDTGTIEALLQRFNDFRLPRLLELKARTDAGEVLTDYDLDFLERVLDDARSNDGIAGRHPELQSLVAKAIALYHEITSRALANAMKDPD